MDEVNALFVVFYAVTLGIAFGGAIALLTNRRMRSTWIRWLIAGSIALLLGGSLVWTYLLGSKGLPKEAAHDESPTATSRADFVLRIVDGLQGLNYADARGRRCGCRV